jgi:hypothetical protein
MLELHKRKLKTLTTGAHGIKILTKNISNYVNFNAK